MIFVPFLVKDNYSVVFNASGMSLLHGAVIVGTAILDGLFRLNTYSSNEHLSLSVNSSKRNRVSTNTGILWHKRLGHISQKRVERLVREGLLGSLDSTDLSACVDCIKAKTTNTFGKKVVKAQSILELIHTDICGHFKPCFTSQKYFITFIDDNSRCIYLSYSCEV